jgi:hypothetical protein
MHEYALMFASLRPRWLFRLVVEMKAESYDVQGGISMDALKPI